MHIRLLTPGDRDFVLGIDPHTDETSFSYRVYTKSGYLICEGETPIGVMSHCVLWDHLPFLNLIYILEEYRHQGFGSRAILLWEEALRKQGYKMALLSTQADEPAQRLYRRLGYLDCGALLFQGTPCDQPPELFLRKVL